ncbi:unnamed protein product [Kluyveromyces dobzhanskii CBS 2104]|uniref:WGS project CCBQ000000000 data, contig 00014 n=1 Tax=Kluyveromyces dobzhanskii CBS 2104 TaxID=1427455 RepID=A0A0A8L8Y3_9SACH|nr:unnamed protein product [Kluyveromyces dobzhanskii CBS 2104]
MDENINKRQQEEGNILAGDATVKKAKKVHSHNREFTTVLVKNLPANYNHHKVRKYFRTCGSILQIDVTDSNDKGSKLARIEFSSYDEALTAVSRTLKKIGFNQITVGQLEDSTIWITNFPPGYDANRLRCLLSQHIDSPILSIRLPSLAFNSRRRFAYVDLTSPDIAIKAVQDLNGKEVDNYNLVAKISNVHERSKRTDDAITDGRELIIKNLSNEVTEEILSNLFKEFGEIEKQRIISRDKSSSDATTNYAFVTFKDKACAENALSINGTIVSFKPLQVSKVMRKAYLERQEVKRLLSSRRPNPNVIGIYPLSDQVTPEQLIALVTEKARIHPSDIPKVLLVSDHEGALIVADKESTVAKISLAINGFKFKNRILKCVSSSELSAHQPNESRSYGHDTKPGFVKPNKSENKVMANAKLSNDDFRKLFLSK